MKEFLFRCRWRATAMTMRVPGKSIEEAQKRVEAILRHQEGGLSCEEIVFLGEAEP